MQLKQKLLVLGVTSALVVASFGAGAYAATKKITLIVNGTVAKVDPITQNNTTYVPLRAAAEMLNATVGFDSKTNTVTVTSKGNSATEYYVIGDFVITQLQVEDNNFSWEVTAEVANTNLKTLSSAMITAIFYDENNKRIGQATGRISDIKPKESKLIDFASADDLTNYKTVKFQVVEASYK